MARGIDVRCVAVGGHSVVVGPLVGEVEVSKGVYAAVEVGVVVSVARVVVGVEVGGTVEGASVVYHRLTGRCCYCCCWVANSVGIGTADYARGCCAVGSLTRIAEDAALPVAGGVDVLVARLRICLHCGNGRMRIWEVMEVLGAAMLLR